MFYWIFLRNHWGFVNLRVNTMDRFLVPYFLDTTTVHNIEKHIRYEIRMSLLAKSILRKMKMTFSRQTLAELDKAFLVRGYSRQLQINEISYAVVYEVFNREFDVMLDARIIYDACHHAYLLGMCPTENTVAH